MNEPKTLETTAVRIVGCSDVIDKDHAPAQIGALWERAAAAGLLRSDAPNYAVYTDYEDRFANRYRVIVGSASDAAPADDQEAIDLPAARYAVFEASGEPMSAARALWTQVWTRWDGREARTFAVDYEQYVGSPADAELTLFIGVKA